MNTISLIGLLVIAACFVLTMVNLRRWDDELQAFQDATMDMLADTSLDVSQLQKRVEALEETGPHCASERTSSTRSTLSRWNRRCRWRRTSPTACPTS